MFESILNIFRDDPLILKGFWSVVFLFLVFLMFMVSRRVIQRFRIEEEKQNLIRKWVHAVVLILYLMVLIRIWLYDFLIQIFTPSVLVKILVTAFSVLFFSLIVYFVRRLIGSLKISIARRRVYSRVISYLILLLFVLIMIRVWAVENLFAYFDSPVFTKLLWSGIVLGFVYLFLYFVRRFINSLKIEIRKKHEYRKRSSYIATLLYIVILIPIWAGSMQNWATVLSVMGAGIALALHEVLLNMAGWAYIVIRRPYITGDRIELGDVRGDVIDIQLFQTTLLEIGNWVDGDQSTGRVVHLPHGQIFKNSLFNYTKGFEYIWNELSVMVTFESNWEKAKKIVLKCGEEESQEIQENVQRKIDRMSREYLIYYKKFTPIVYTKIEDSGVKITLRYLTEAKKRRSGEDTISRKILTKIGAARDINFAYPTYRITQRGEKQ
ncbi:mechanosensitive ion channel domain-containing protein [bacterium]